MLGKILKNSFIVLTLIIVGKLLSFLRDIFISAKFGVTYQTDAYFAANNVPSLIFIAFLSSYIVLLIPTYKKIQIQSGDSEANLFVSRLINIFAIIAVSLSILGFIFINQLIYLVAPGFNAETHELSVLLGKILIISFPFSSITTILATISNANNKYFAPHIIPVFSSLFVILSILIFADKFGIIVIAVSGVVAFVFQLIIQIVISRQHFTYTFKVKLFDADVKKMSILVVPIFLGFSIDQINLLVNSIICSNLSEGSLSSLIYAQRLQATINGTLSTALLTVIYPLISKLLHENNISQLVEIIKNSLRGVFIVLLPIVIFLSFNATSFISVVYFRGKFDAFAVEQTSNVFFFYSFNVLFISIREFILRIYYIKDNTKIPFVTSAISLIINIVLSLLLVKYFDVSGLSLANLIATGISTIILFWYISLKTDININFTQTFKFLKTLFIPVSFFITTQFFQHKFIIIGNNIFLFLLSFVIATLLFFIILLIFKQKEAILILKLLKNKIHV